MFTTNKIDNDMIIQLKTYFIRIFFKTSFHKAIWRYYQNKYDLNTYLNIINEISVQKGAILNIFQ